MICCRVVPNAFTHCVEIVHHIFWLINCVTLQGTPTCIPWQPGHSRVCLLTKQATQPLQSNAQA